MYRALNGLSEKKFIFKVDRDFVKSYAGVGSYECYLLNPNVVDLGSWHDLRKLRQTVTREWDFKSLEVKQQLCVEEYEGLLDVSDNIENHDIEEVKHKVSNDGKFTQTSIVVTKNPKKEQASLSDDSIIDLGEKDNKESTLKSKNNDKEFVFMTQSFEVISKMLDRIKVLEEQGKN